MTIDNLETLGYGRVANLPTIGTPTTSLDLQ
jgi:hypothetical protein